MPTNTLLTDAIITNEAARILKNNLKFPMAFNNQYASEFRDQGKKAGDTISVRVPPRYIGGRGESITPQPTTDRYMPLALQPLFNMPIAFSVTDRTLALPEFSNNYLKPAMAQLANDIDLYCASMYKKVFNIVGVANTNPTSQVTATDPILCAGQLISQWGGPMDEARSAIISPSMQASLVSWTAGLFNPAATISQQYRTGKFAEQVLGFDWMVDQNVYTHTTGTEGSVGADFAGTLSANVADGATSIAVTGFEANTTFVEGDLIQITGVKFVNPMNRQPFGGVPGSAGSSGTTNNLATVVVTAGVTLDGAGAGTVSISPALYYGATTSGQQLQNINTQPLSGAVVTKVGVSASNVAGAQNLLFHRDAFMFASVDLDLPGGGAEAYRTSDSGIAMRMWNFWDGMSNTQVCRFDVLCGAAPLYPELAVRFLGA